MTAVSGPGGTGEAWGNPMATSIPAPGYYGNSGGGFGAGSGMTLIQQMVSVRRREALECDEARSCVGNTVYRHFDLNVFVNCL